MRQCEFCGFKVTSEIDVWMYERYNNMQLCDRCVDKIDFINNGHDPKNTWTDEYSRRYNLKPFPVKNVYPTPNIKNQEYGCKK